MSRTSPSQLSRFALVALLLFGAPLHARAQVSVEGAWTVTEWTRDGETWAAQPGIFLFTTTHYSFLFLTGPEARAVPAEPGPGQMTDSDRLTAFNEFTANAGRYSIEGSTLTTRAYMAKNPGVMAGFPDNAREIAVSRNGDTLTLTFGNGGVATLIRREGQASPG